MEASSRSDDSFASAASVRYRIFTLESAQIFFEAFSKTIAEPAPASELFTWLTFWPDIAIDERTGEFSAPRTGSLSAAETAEIEAAVRMAERLPSSEIESHRLAHEGVWMRKINWVLLADLASGLGINENYTWLEGRDLRPNPATLSDPKPDAAFGLKPSKADQSDDPLSKSVLLALRNSPRLSLTYSPSDMGDIVYPAVVHEAQSLMGNLLWAENKVANGVTRCLSLLAELSRCSGVPHQHCTVGLVSAGSQWKFYVAYQDLTEDEKVVSISTAE